MNFQPPDNEDPRDDDQREYYAEAFDLARKYSIETERFDRSVCTGPIVRGSIMPRGPQELGMIGRNAAQVRSRLEVEARAKNIDWRDVRRAAIRYEDSPEYLKDMEGIK